MNFSNIVGNISDKNFFEAKTQLTRLTLDLGVRKGNRWVGSGLGGNNFQLLVLMSLSHTLTARSIKIEVADEGVVWGSKFLRTCKLKKLRRELDKVFPQIKEKFKYNALAIESLVNSETFHKKFVEHEQEFPNVARVFDKGSIPNIESLNDMEKLLLSYILCSELADQLDSGLFSNVSRVGRVLDKMPLEIMLMSVRQFIRINRLVEHNLDEHPDWEPMINRLNKSID